MKTAVHFSLRPIGLIAALLLLLAVAAIWSVGVMVGHRNSAQRALEDLTRCRELAAAIESLRGRPAAVAAEAMETQELGRHIEAAADAAGLPVSAIVGIAPMEAQRIEGLPYLRKPTTLALRGASLEQVGAFLYNLNVVSRLSVRDLRLSAVQRDEAADTWNVDLTVTYLIYSPVKAPTAP